MSSKSTKTQLAETLKDMMRTQDLDHITIEELTNRAGVTRNTFYYHFNDIYALLTWVFDQEIGSPMRRHAQFDEWQSAYRLLLTYITDNRDFCIASFHSVGRDLLEQVLYKFAFQLTTSVVDDVDDNLPKQLRDDIGDFFGLAIVAQVTFWLRNGMQESQDRLVQRADIMLRGSIKNAVKNGRDVYGYYEVDPHKSDCD
ncbi:TetR/AcrR family transcriptional regulator C-terminal domain-containing protein [Lacticaseibacillus pabuli]|uniref:TetR/AcrR family transcriptional regulator C-terminal domain-containing protein n=1 Tax=Lacticaseibacillus pabuli TaxID=3025672 RepID=A0ABY7WRL1_9LACO|nr:TetR/AcrR family transcriptional regulator [Lacticaseibacillus sp. KACC 23028]WDF81652.1 TetR/AcrR family transcriptional regulator C-terminal domain-containing protein [Lacticaseibacillus sp. KACC 23028]